MTEINVQLHNMTTLSFEGSPVINQKVLYVLSVLLIVTTQQRNVCGYECVADGTVTKNKTYQTQLSLLNGTLYCGTIKMSSF
jgi:hypothetical protein